MRVSFYKKIKKAIAQFPLLTALLLVFLVMITVAIASVETTTDAEKQAALEDAIMRSALHCYSLEGAYPSDITYLEEHYNLAINREDYIVFYELFASNIAPDVTVIVRSVGISAVVEVNTATATSTGGIA